MLKVVAGVVAGIFIYEYIKDYTTKQA
jgi:hypothetical protein